VGVFYLTVCKWNMSEKPKTGNKGKDAYQLFPDIMQKFSAAPAKDAQRKTAPPPQAQVQDQPISPRKLPKPPGPPDISWLWKEEFESVASVSEIPTTLLLMPAGDDKTRVGKAFEGIGYLVETAASEQAAIDKMKFVNLAGVVLQADNREGALEQSILHNYMKWLPMAERRQIYYVLIGPGFHTMYDLQALSLSANLVINIRDLDKIDIILRKGLQDHENLFGPFLAVLREYGKS
jgi:hypothetical protein